MWNDLTRVDLDLEIKYRPQSWQEKTAHSPDIQWIYQADVPELSKMGATVDLMRKLNQRMRRALYMTYKYVAENSLNNIIEYTSDDIVQVNEKEIRHLIPSCQELAVLARWKSVPYRR